MTDLSRDAILAVQDLNMKKIAVPQWGGDVYIKQLSGAEQDRYEQDSFMSKDRNIINLRARLICLAVCDKEGNKLFKPGDMDSVSKKSSGVLNILFEEILALNKITEDDLEDIAKN